MEFVRFSFLKRNGYRKLKEKGKLKMIFYSLEFSREYERKRKKKRKRKV
jgi:hypothetical protein